MHRYQISTFGSVAIVFAVIGVNQTIFTGVGSLDAVAAGWLILAIVDILWVLYFTSEEDSLALHIFNSMGTGGLAPPSRRRRTMVRTEPPMHNMAGNGGYANNYASGGGISSHDPKAMGGPIGSPGVRSQNSFNGGQSLDQGAPRSIGNAGAGSIGAAGGETRSIGGGAGSAGGADMGPASPLMGGAAGLGAGSGGPGSAELGQVPDSYSYTAKALYAYTASPDDPNEISFTKGEVLDIVDKQGKWWQAKKADGTIGSRCTLRFLLVRLLIICSSCAIKLPSNHLEPRCRVSFSLFSMNEAYSHSA